MSKFIKNSLLILIIGLFAYIFKTSDGYSNEQIITILTLSAVTIVVFFKDKNVTATQRFRLLRPSVLLLLGMCIIAYQNGIDLLVGNYDMNTNVFLHHSLITKGIAFASMAIVAFIFGYTNTSMPFNSINSKSYNQEISLDALIVLSTIFTLMFLSTVDSAFITGQSYVESGSLEDSHTNNSEILLNICNAAVLIQYAINNTGRKMSLRRFIGGMPKLFIILLVLYLVLRLISGAREPVIRTSLILLFSYVYANREQPFRNFIFVICIIATSFILSIISIGRGVITNDLSKKYETGLAVYEARQSFSPSTEELASSQFCDMIAINEFEKQDNEHLHGAIQGRYLAVLFIPNRLLENIWPVETEMQGSAYYITTLERGRKSNIGLGTTLQSDFYLDFGIVGMIVCMMLMGVLLKKVDLSLYSDVKLHYSLFATTMIIMLSSSAFYLSRSAFIPSIRLPLYTFILLYINRLIHDNRYI